MRIQVFWGEDGRLASPDDRRKALQILDEGMAAAGHLAHRPSEEERQRILLTCNEPEFAELPPGAQTSSTLAFIRSESCVELRQHRTANQRAWDLALPRPGDRRPEPRVVVWNVAQREETAIAGIW